jgi:hypothetical protein
MKTGKLVRNGEYRISETAEVDSIRNESGLAVDLLGADNGYRVFYHNKYNNVMMLHYTQYTDWTDGGFVSQDNATGMALGSAHIDKENITVAFPKDSDDIEISRLEKAGQWRLGLFFHSSNLTLMLLTYVRILSDGAGRLIHQRFHKSYFTN